MLKRKTGLVAVALAVLCVLLGLLVVGCRKDNFQLTAAGITNFDSVTLSQNLRVGGTSTLVGAVSQYGSVSNAAGAYTITDNVLIDGQADAEQLVVQGNGTQTNKILVVETSAGTDKFTVDNTGAVVAAGTMTWLGPVNDSAGDVRINDPVLITGTLGASGNTTLGGTVTWLGPVNDSGGDVRINDPVLITGTLEASGNTTLGGTVTWLGPVNDSAGDVRINDPVLITGTLGASGAATLGSTLTVAGPVNDSAGDVRINDPVLVTGTVTWLGPVNDSGGDLRLNDNTLITGTLGVAGAVTWLGPANDSEGDVRINDNTLITGTLGVSSNVDVGGYLWNDASSLRLLDDVLLEGWAKVSTWLRFDAQSVITVTDGSTVTPTGTYQQIRADGAVGAALSASGFTAGDMLVMTNITAQTITITDTGNVYLAGNWVADQYDTLMLWFDGTRWLEISRSDAST